MFALQNNSAESKAKEPLGVGIEAHHYDKTIVLFPPSSLWDHTTGSNHVAERNIYTYIYIYIYRHAHREN